MRRFFRVATALTLAFGLLIPSVGAITVEETLELLELYYLDEIPATAYQQTTVEGVLATLGDPYTVYMPATDYEDFIESVNGSSVVGIGLQIHLVQDKGVEILAVLPDSPALEGGLEAGDCILKVDGVSITSTEQAQELIAGEAGTTVTLTISNSSGRVYNRTFTRQEVAIPIVTYATVDGVPVIDCDSFGSSTAATVREAMTEYADWMGAYVMDLQNNPGGTDSASAGTAGIFVGGNIICYYVGQNSATSYIYTLSSTVDYTDAPLIILTSGYSASGSEMFAGAIRAYDAGIAIGSRTYGKGIAQKALDEDSYPELFDGDSLKITTYRFYAPDGATNDTVGVIPTLTIDSAYVQDVAVLLASPQPETVDGYLKLEAGGSTFYIDVEQALTEDYLPAFQELLSAITPGQTMLYGYEGAWIYMGMDWISEYFEVEYESRYYTDLNHNAYEDEINTLATHGILPQVAGGDYNPQDTVTRGEFAYMLAYAMQLRVVEGTPFSDVAIDHTYVEGIAALYAKGIIQGYEDGEFRPDDAITGQEAMVMLANAATWMNKDAKMAQTSDGITQEYLDEFDYYPVWARESMVTLDYIGGLLEGIEATEDIQADEAGAMIYQLFQGTGILWD